MGGHGCLPGVSGMRKFTICQWNCRSIKNKSSLVKATLFRDSDVVGLQETFLKHDDAFSIPGKHIYRLDRVGRAGGGLLIAVSSSLPSYRIPHQVISTEIEVLGVCVQFGPVQVTIVNVYSRSGAGMDSLFEFVRLVNGPVLLVGDFNLHHQLWGCSLSSRKSEAFVDWLNNQNLCLMNTASPTHVSPALAPSLIDLSICSAGLLGQLDCQVSDNLFGSDHFPVLIELAGCPDPPPPSVHFKWPSIANEVNCLLGSVTSCDYVHFSSVVSEAMGRFCVSRSPTHKRFPGWWTARCSNLFYQKKFLLKSALRQISVEVWCRYKKVAAKLRRVIMEAKRAFWDRCCRDADTANALFRIFNCLRNRSLSPQGSRLCLWDGRRHIFCNVQQADMFADRFAGVSDRFPFPVTFGVDPPWELNQPFSAPELLCAVQRSRVTSPGPDKVSARFFKGLSAHSLDVLLQVYNESWASGNLPADWTLATVLPILKPGKPPNLASSYRPIALTSVTAKLCERMIVGRLTKFLVTKKLLHANHLGFLPFRDSQSAVTRLFIEVERARKDRKFFVGVSLDLKGAYDSVSFDGLILKCAGLGITGNILLWIHNFISYRRFRVSWRGVLSSVRSVNRGVPQGAVLSPILFTIFLSDLFEAIGSRVRCIIYADDILVYCCSDSIQDGRKFLQESLWDIQRWCRFWHMELNTDKCLAVNLSRRRGECDFSFWINSRPVRWSHSLKFLGFQFARRGGFRHQVDYLRGKALKRINILKALASRTYGARSFHLLTLANASIRGLADYGAPILGMASDSLFKRLEVINTSALRVALGLPRWSPNIVVRMHARSLPLKERVRVLALRYWTKHISLDSWSPLGDFLQDHWSSAFSLGLLEDFHVVLDEIGGDRDGLIKFYFPKPCAPGSVRFHLSDLPFQSSQVDLRLVAPLFLEFVDSLGGVFDLIGTDASKSVDRTSIAGCSSSGQFGYLVNSINSIFSAEALAIGLALDELVSLSRSVIICSDSLSVLTALSQVSLRSPKVILWLWFKIRITAMRVPRVVLCWVPGHCGIAINERADSIAGCVSDRDLRIDWISPEDLVSFVRKQKMLRLEGEFAGTQYAGSVGIIPPISVSRLWARNRREDVLTTRLLCRMHVTPEILFRFHLAQVKDCASCLSVDSMEHIILSCRKYTAQRQHFFQVWISSLYFCSLREFLLFFCKDSSFRLATLKFLKSIDRF